MKKTLFLFLSALLLASPVLADPMATVGKLVKAQKQANGLYPCPFTEAEAREFIEFMKARYEAAGTKLSDAQAAVMAGHSAGMASIYLQQQKQGKQ